jgi:hypothetical protein
MVMKAPPVPLTAIRDRARNVGTRWSLTAAIESDIARRAFELYCDRGREDGHDVDDWLNAERELRYVSNSSAA